MNHKYIWVSKFTKGEESLLEKERDTKCQCNLKLF